MNNVVARSKFHLAGTNEEQVLIILGQNGKPMTVAEICLTWRGKESDTSQENRTYKALYHLTSLGLASLTVPTTITEAKELLHGASRLLDGDASFAKTATYKLTEEGLIVFAEQNKMKCFDMS